VVLVERRLGIEAVHLRQPAVHEQKDDVLRFCRMVKPARREDLWILSGQRCRRRERLANHSGKREHAEPVADSTERFTSGDGLVGFVAHMSVIRVIRVSLNSRRGTRSN
jgi:hypothetical protein